jgi:putative iron-regulated protein
VKPSSIRSVAAAAIVIIGAAACGSDDNSSSPAAETAVAPAVSGAPAVTEAATVDTSAPSAAAVPDEAAFASVATTYADLVSANYAAAIASATTMQTAIDAFVAAPTDETLAAARTAWLTARDDYGPTEAFRLYDGPIDDPEDGPEGQINAWPMDEAYIDYVEGDETAGIVNDVAGVPEITTDVLVAANEVGGETNISTGWHAIEFLLWGQDMSADGPGNRPVTDYTTSPVAERRATYLQLLTDLLIDDLTFVADQWAADGGAYRTEFLADPTVAVQRLLRGIGALSSGELGGERMAVAYETKDQEDEHSCFSDNTNADVLNNAIGIRMVYLADYEGIDGMSPSDLVASVDPDLDAKVRAQMDQSVDLIAAFPATFETMISSPEGDPANTAFLDALVSVEDQGEMIAAAAAALGLEISIEV